MACSQICTLSVCKSLMHSYFSFHTQFTLSQSSFKASSMSIHWQMLGIIIRERRRGRDRDRERERERDSPSHRPGSGVFFEWRWTGHCTTGTCSQHCLVAMVAPGGPEEHSHSLLLPPERKRTNCEIPFFLLLHLLPQFIYIQYTCTVFKHNVTASSIFTSYN